MGSSLLRPRPTYGRRVCGIVARRPPCDQLSELLPLKNSASFCPTTEPCRFESDVQHRTSYPWCDDGQLLLQSILASKRTSPERTKPSGNCRSTRKSSRYFISIRRLSDQLFPQNNVKDLVLGDLLIIVSIIKQAVKSLSTPFPILLSQINLNFRST